ncbi:MAG TPA: alpha-1,4-glucan--maltose-1-phosphate maltosyltransferase [bacterium]|nr:alpha-1,4-glucan--maltose-1-phosphate maltosyltransferase [bacterium]
MIAQPDDAPMNQHILIEAITPAVDQGRYPAKWVAGRPCVVEADIFRDGHEVLRAAVRWRRKGEQRFTEAPMEPLVNDRWRGEMYLPENTRYEFTVEAWTDVYASWLEDLRKRVAVAEPVASEVIEGTTLLESFVDGAKGAYARTLREAVQALRAWTADGGAAAAAKSTATSTAKTATKAAGKRTGARKSAADNPGAATAGAGTSTPAADNPGAAALAIAEAPALLAAVAATQPRFGATAYEPFLELVVDRPRALFGAWYELFPRSQGPVPGEHGTFADAARRLPDIRDLGFDVVYLPPIHPVGTTHRKGRNNALRAAPDDPGSPWAIGSKDGGHMAVEPRLGTLEDFDRFVATAETLGMEVALDFALQVSPDHPWVREHPEWFYHRPDGTIKYAENPPKKYQDVYPMNFDTENRQALWDEIRDVMEFWVGHGVKIFRVDNPHTKPLAFWQWVIGGIQQAHPEVIFLSEAFTRPKVMKALAKVGFTQSYTYFTWRNHKWDLTEYLTELTDPERAAYFRPNFFANTPDILHEVLQTGGRPAFKLRLVLAATLSPSYGIYSGYELCENEAVPGTEEYLNSEKYEIKVRDWNAPGNIREFIARVNTIRRQNAALQELTNLRFLATDNDQILFYAKSDAARDNVLLIAVNLDPHTPQACTAIVPPDVIADEPVGAYEVHDLLTGARYTWGASNFIRLDPQAEPAHILRVERRHP